MIARSLQGKFLVLAIFLLGGVFGWFAAGHYNTRVRGASDSDNPRVKAQRDINRFHDYLGLSAEQREQVRQIMEAAGPEFRKLAEQTRPQYDALRQRNRARIREILTEEQRRKYDEWNARRDRSRTN